MSDFPKGLSSPGGSLLDRVQLQTANKAFSDMQLEVDGLVGSTISTVSDIKMMASFLGAGLAGRFIRLGTVSAIGRSLTPLAVQGIPHAAALAGESAVFTLMERHFAHGEGHAVTQPFHKAWASAAINLGSIKIFGTVARGQNLITQHLLIDAGMVGGHHAGYALGMTDKPQGNIAQQIVRAEGMNLSMKGSLALFHGLSPQLSALERSVGLMFESRGSSPNPTFFQAFPPPFLSMAANGRGLSEGRRISFAEVISYERTQGPERLAILGSGNGDGSGEREFVQKYLKGEIWKEPFGGLGREAIRQAENPPPPRKPGQHRKVNPRESLEFGVSSESRDGKRPWDEMKRVTAAMDLGVIGDPASRPALEKALSGDSSAEVRGAAVLALGRIGDPAAAPALRKAMREDPWPGVRFWAGLVLRELGWWVDKQ